MNKTKIVSCHVNLYLSEKYSLVAFPQFVTGATLHHDHTFYIYVHLLYTVLQCLWHLKHSSDAGINSLT